MQIDKIGIVECCDSFWLLNFVLLIGVISGGKRGVALIALIALIKGISWLMFLWAEVIYIRENNGSNNKVMNYLYVAK